MPAEYDGLAVYGLEHGLRVKDLAAAMSFWRDLLGFESYAEIIAPHGVHVYGLRYGNSMIKLMYIDDEQTTDGHRPERYGMASDAHQQPSPFASHYITVHVLNALALQHECEAVGIKVLVPYSQFVPHRTGDPACAFVLVEDPDGNTVEFSQGSPWIPPSAK